MAPLKKKRYSKGKESESGDNTQVNLTRSSQRKILASLDNNAETAAKPKWYYHY